MNRSKQIFIICTPFPHEYNETVNKTQNMQCISFITRPMISKIWYKKGEKSKY